MRIAIVDDNASDRSLIREQLIQELKERDIDAGLEEYDSGEAFREAFAPRRFAIVFLDIYMKEVSGIEIAEMLYQKDPRCKIIFLSSSREHLQHGYYVRAVFYLVKPYGLEQLRRALDFCFPEPDPADILQVRMARETVAVPRRDILYIAARGHYHQICLEDRALKSLDTFTEATRSLEGDERLFCCCRGYIVHLQKIQHMENDEFVMEDGQHIPISRRMRSEASRLYHANLFSMAKERRYEETD